MICGFMPCFGLPWSFCVCCPPNIRWGRASEPILQNTCGKNTIYDTQICDEWCARRRCWCDDYNLHHHTHSHKLYEYFTHNVTVHMGNDSTSSSICDTCAHPAHIKLVMSVHDLTPTFRCAVVTHTNVVASHQTIAGLVNAALVLLFATRLQVVHTKSRYQFLH